MVEGEKVWLAPFKERYLENYIAHGGSKVKILTGEQGSGKTYSLQWLEGSAKELGYEVVSLSVRKDTDWSFTDLRSLYMALASKVDYEAIICGLCINVAERLELSSSSYRGTSSLLPLMMKKEQIPESRAKQRIEKELDSLAFTDSGLSHTFAQFVKNILEMRLIDDRPAISDACHRWFLGEKLGASDKKITRLYQRLTKVNARQWLYSLIRLIHLGGKKGFVVTVDDMDAMMESKAFTKKKIENTLELIRQLIDDTETLERFMLILSGRTSIFEDHKKGFASHLPLYMRLQSGLLPVSRFNKFADIIDLDKLISQGYASGR